MFLILLVILQGNSASENWTEISGRIRCSVTLSPRSEVNDTKLKGEEKSGSLQISPSRDGPWTTMRLNYAAPAACWQFGDNIVASEVSVHDGNRYVYIRSLVSVHNDTDSPLALQLKLWAAERKTTSTDNGTVAAANETNELVEDEFFETQTYNPVVGGWVGCGDSLEVVLNALNLPLFFCLNFIYFFTLLT